MAVRKLDFYAWHPLDYRADTTHLTREENFAYRAILDEIFITAQDTCQLVDDDTYLMHIAKAKPREWQAIRRALIDGPRALLRKRGDCVYSARLEEEIRRAQSKAGSASDAAAERWQRERDASALRSDSVGNESQTKKKPLRVSKSKKSSVANATPDAVSSIRTALRQAGIGVTKAAEKLVERWAASPGPDRIAELLGGNLDRVQAARSPLSYFRAIVNDDATKPEAEVAAAETEETELPFVEKVMYAARSVYSWIEDHGDPTTSTELREAFDSARLIQQESDDEDRWARWLRLCAETGVQPTPVMATPYPQQEGN